MVKSRTLPYRYRHHIQTTEHAFQKLLHSSRAFRNSKLKIQKSRRRPSAYDFDVAFSYTMPDASSEAGGELLATGNASFPNSVAWYSVLAKRIVRNSHMASHTISCAIPGSMHNVRANPHWLKVLLLASSAPRFVTRALSTTKTLATSKTPASATIQ